MTHPASVLPLDGDDWWCRGHLGREWLLCHPTDLAIVVDGWNTEAVTLA